MRLVAFTLALPEFSFGRRVDPFLDGSRRRFIHSRPCEFQSAGISGDRGWGAELPAEVFLAAVGGRGRPDIIFFAARESGVGDLRRQAVRAAFGGSAFVVGVLDMLWACTCVPLASLTVCCGPSVRPRWMTFRWRAASSGALMKP
jgi:hypothetical protein